MWLRRLENQYFSSIAMFKMYLGTVGVIDQWNASNEQRNLQRD